MPPMIDPISFDRRHWLRTSACGFGSIALASLLSGQTRTVAAATEDETSLPQSGLHFPARAKRVLFLFMQGGPSHVDSFDYKPTLSDQHGNRMPFADARVAAKTGQKASEHKVMKSPWAFKQYGESGKWVSDLFPEVAQHVDDLCMIHSCHTEGVAHGPATLFLHCGSKMFIRPSMGSWISYGLGTENENLPTFVHIAPSAGNGGPRNYGSAFLPSIHQGTALGQAGSPAAEARIRNLTNGSLDRPAQRRQLDLLRELSAQRLRPGDQELEAVIQSYELAWRMQTNAPSVMDLSAETEATRRLYGIGEKETDDFGRKCLMARRLSEAGVRFVQVTYGDNSANPAWDQHSNLPQHANHARRVDKPIAGLLTDLKQRGLLEDTLVWFGSEFGRTPYAQDNGTGRDHNPNGFTMWLAGGGTKPGLSYGETDEFGHQAVKDKVHMHDFHATLLHLLGIDHERLTYHYDGRDFRLTDVHGRVVHDIIA